jgi:predicted ATP-binding protein involved in virulence
MRIDHLRIQNFKCFADFEMSLEPGVNIIYGVNGVGKTSILEALSVAAGSFFREIDEVEHRQLLPQEARLATRQGRLEYQRPVELDVIGSNFFENSRSFEWHPHLGDEDDSLIYTFSRAAVAAVRDGGMERLPIVAYFSCRRLFNENGNGQSNKPIGRFLGYYNALNDRSIRKEVDNWLNDEATKAFNAKENGLPGDPYKSLQLIYDTLLGIFPGKYKRVYYYKPQSDDRLTSGLFFADEAGDITSLQMMSDGYRNTVNLILEIAWRCVQLNAFLGEKALQESEGIVMVDEIDLHLHPKLQQEIVGMLQRIFPKIQFILTTHSPLILGSAESTAWKLEDGQLIRQPQLFGKDASYIIRHFMDASDRSPLVEQKIGRYFELINAKRGRSPEALRLRKELDFIDEGLMAEADVMIRFLED